MEYKVFDVEEKVTQTGKSLKKLTLQGEGKQYPDKNVTMWSDHPLFANIAAGQKIDVELDIKDSTVPNPHGGFYKNKTVIGPKGGSKASANAPQSPQSDGSARVVNMIEFKVIPQLEAIYGRLGLALKAMGIKIDEAKIEYPAQDESNDAHTLDAPMTEEELADAIPF